MWLKGNNGLGRIKLNYEYEIMNGVEMEPLFLNKRQIKSLVWHNFSLLFDAIDSEK